ncbi:NUDIX domain-containing protein [Peterkaempfera bronchialis]|nr:NUDIX domain-containing protein [Peterkaempfera bronchialis]
MEESTFRELRRRIGYPDAAVPVERDWQRLGPGYTPVEYTADSVRRRVPDWDRPDLAAVWRQVRRLSSCRVVPRCPATGRPLNPAGPTGISGFGRLWSLGPNLTADAVVTDGSGDGVRVLLVERGDTGQLAFPGGFSEPGADGSWEHPLRTAVRETWEETGVVVPGGTARVLRSGVAAGSLRNTDNAWIESTAFHIRLPSGAGGRPQPVAGDDARDTGWFPLSEIDPSRMSDVHAGIVRGLLPRRR